MTMTIRQAVLEVIQVDPAIATGALAAAVSEKVGRPVTPSTVSVTRSDLRRDGIFDWRAAAKERGLPINGHGATNGGNGMDLGPTVNFHEAAADAEPETEADRDKRIRKRFKMQDRLIDRVTTGGCKSLIVSGPPGMGKSYGVEQALMALDAEGDAKGEAGEPGEKRYRTISGAISVPGLIIAAWETCEKDGILVLDDCDDLFRDETGMNILKTMLDTSERRIITYQKNATWMDEMGIPRSFEYKGSVVFLTNIDFEMHIDKGARMAPHFQAFIDRSLYLCLTLRSLDDYIRDNARKFHTLSARLIKHIAETIDNDPDGWEDEIEVTKMRSHI